MPEFAEDVDVVIVGSGPTGAAYARVVTDARPQTKVLQVESGPIVTDPPGLHVANIIDQQARECAQTASQGPKQYRYEISATRQGQRGRSLILRPGLFRVGEGDVHGDGLPVAQQSSNVGGMGSHWFGACPRPGELERIDFLAPHTLDEAYVTAERLLQVSNTQFLDCSVAARVRRVLGDTLDEGRPPAHRVQAMPMAIRRTADGVHRCGTNVVFGKLLTGANGHFQLRQETLVEKITMIDGHAAGVRLRDLASGTVTAVRARYVVVAGDSLRSPQLLFASGIRPAALGHYLNEHPQVSFMAEVDGMGNDWDGSADSKVRAISPLAVTWIPYTGADFPFHVMVIPVDPSKVTHAGRRPGRTPIVSMQFFTAQELRFENRVEFSDTAADWIGMPAMTIHHTVSERDRATLEYAKSEALRLSRLLGKPVEGETPRILPSGSSLHYQGTMRMGTTDNGTSVCDPACRVWGTHNLYVAGNGVIPARTACNPTLTSVALAVIGARDIVRRLNASARHRPLHVA